MKILYDYQAFSHQRFGGVSRFMAEMISRVARYHEINLALKASDNIHLKETGLDSGVEKEYDIQNHFISFYKSKKKEKLFKWLSKISPKLFPWSKTVNKQASIKKIKQEVFDLFHPTYFDPYFLPYLKGKPFVLTIHDMIDEVFGSNPITPRRKKLLAEKAAHIITVSEHTKQDVVRILGINPEKITAIPLACSPLSHIPKKPLQLPDKYLLFVGNRSKYKNFDLFVHALESCLLNWKNVYVVCTGTPFNEEEIELLQKTGLYDRFIQLFVQQDQFYQLYNQAIAFVFPSSYEGFGIPILEAFNANCPVILSRSSCFPEVAGEAALYFEQGNVKQLTKAIERLVQDPDLRKELIKKGAKQALNFSWEKTANETINVYKQVLESERK